MFCIFQKTCRISNQRNTILSNNDDETQPNTVEKECKILISKFQIKRIPWSSRV